jgi:hypothetical protein
MHTYDYVRVFLQNTPSEVVDPREREALTGIDLCASSSLGSEVERLPHFGIAGEKGVDFRKLVEGEACVLHKDINN